jgi:hypothetical protein
MSESAVVNGFAENQKKSLSFLPFLFFILKSLSFLPFFFFFFFFYSSSSSSNTSITSSLNKDFCIVVTFLTYSSTSAFTEGTVYTYTFLSIPGNISRNTSCTFWNDSAIFRYSLWNDKSRVLISFFRVFFLSPYSPSPSSSQNKTIESWLNEPFSNSLV